jgi:hypothetical protein
MQPRWIYTKSGETAFYQEGDYIYSKDGKTKFSVADG